MSKIAVVIQRYGKEVNGGAETHARLIAKKLSGQHEVNVLTTKSINHNSWEDYYSKNEENIDGIKVKRFSSIPSKHGKKFRKYRRIVLKKTKLQLFLGKLSLNSYFDNLNRFEPNEVEKKIWLELVGPNSPDLIEYIKTHKNTYDCFIFFTYLFYPTVEGLKIVGEKSILIPTAHDEPEFYASVYKSTYKNAKFIMYNTSTEKKLVEQHHKIAKLTQNDIAGIGLEKINLAQNNKYIYPFKYLLYIGRIEKGKGCFELYNFFNKFKKTNSNFKLIFIGKQNPELTPNENIIFTGFVSESVKQLILSNCEALIIPSYYESLSIVTLEAMYEKKIVIANGECEVLKDHIIKSNSGFYYHNDEELFTVLTAISTLSREEINQHGANAKKYVESNYTWESILDKFDKAIDFIQKS